MKYCIGFATLAGCLLLLSSFVGSDVDGGIRGGTPVKSELVGLRTIVTWYQGGERVTYQADRIVGAQLRSLSVAAVAIALVIGVIVAFARRIGPGSVIGGMLGGGLVGALIAFVTGMPVATQLKGATPDGFMTFLAILIIVGVPVSILIGRALARSEGWN